MVNFVYWVTIIISVTYSYSASRILYV